MRLWKKFHLHRLIVIALCGAFESQDGYVHRHYIEIHLVTEIMQLETSVF